MRGALTRSPAYANPDPQRTLDLVVRSAQLLLEDPRLAAASAAAALGGVESVAALRRAAALVVQLTTYGMSVAELARLAVALPAEADDADDAGNLKPGNFRKPS